MTMVYRVYVEKREGFDVEAKALADDVRALLQVPGLTKVRLLNRYDVSGVSDELFEEATRTIFSEPQLDTVFAELPKVPGAHVFAVEYQPGQFDQRADSAAQCIQILSQGERPAVRNARVYLLEGDLSDADVEAIKRHVINPVEAREASLDPVDTLQETPRSPEPVATVSGFRDLDQDGLVELQGTYGFAMDLDDLLVCQQHFQGELRDPTVTELRVIDTYWSDHCRHTTFLTEIDHVQFEDPVIQETYEDYLAMRNDLGRTKPVTLMDLGTIAGKYLRKEGRLPHLDESEEINACTVKIQVDTPEGPEEWLLLFKNETHNHPTEIEPFGGAATCIGGAIRDPLSGRAYVYAAMRVTGAGDPLKPVSESLPGKLPQRTIVTKSAAGYSSYGNQIGLTTGQVDEIYHGGYEAKRMEIGAVIGAVPAAHVRREVPEPGDVVILLGGKTGRDGCGGATGSSKSHTTESLETGGPEVQKGNAPEERKLQRLFRNPQASLLIKRCNDFGAGGVSVAVGELADGLAIDLDAVPKKYEGLDGTELAVSESQERMAVVVESGDVERFLALASEENLEATVVAAVTDDRRLTMVWNGQTIVDLSRDFLDTNGAQKHAVAHVTPSKPFARELPEGFTAGLLALADDLNVASKRGLSERFDSTIGSGTVLMPFGGTRQRTPSQAMVHKISREEGDTTTSSLMAWGFNPFISEKSPYHGAYLAVVESVAKLVATGASLDDTYLTFQEYFERLRGDAVRWGKPLASLLGALRAQKELSLAAIGGKDSMSGSFEDLDVPPTLVSFAVTTDPVSRIISPEFKEAGHVVTLLAPRYGDDGLPEGDSLIETLQTVADLTGAGKVRAAYTATYGGVAEGILKMGLGNEIGLDLHEDVTLEDLFGYSYGSFILEFEHEGDAVGTPLGKTTVEAELRRGEECIALSRLEEIYEAKLEPIYPSRPEPAGGVIPSLNYTVDTWPSPAAPTNPLDATTPLGATAPLAAPTPLRGATPLAAPPRILIPVFPGTNTEYDAAKVIRAAGAEPEIVVIRNLTPSQVSQSVEHFAERISQAQAIFIPGGFSGGDEPDGSAKLITSFFRSGPVREQVGRLLNDRDGLMLGICNGFQALVKLGLVPYGEIVDAGADSPTLTFNTVGYHQSRLVRTRVASNLSPWLMNTAPGEIYTVAISHGEGRFVASEEVMADLITRGQVATQYVDLEGNPTSEVGFNPNNSTYAVEGVTSPDGRVLGKMGHTERVGEGLYKNVPGEFDMGLFTSAVQYFS